MTLAAHVDFDMFDRQLPASGMSVSTMMAEPSRAITPLAPTDPARIGYPPTFPIELALRTSSTRAICEAYGISSDEWDRMRYEPLFLADLERAIELVKKDGMSFVLKAKLQAEELLKTSWRTIHDKDTPPNVKADLIKATMRWALYDNPKVVAAEGGSNGGAPGFAIQINFQNVQR